MAKSEIVSTAAKPEDLDKAYASATKALSVLGIKMATKKPNPAVIGPIMTKSKKKAEFKLGGDPAKVIKLTVECDGNVNTLGLLDVAGEKDLAKRLVIMKSLVECGLATKAELAAFEKTIAPPKADPKVIANIDRRIEAEQKKVAEARKIDELFQKADTYDKAVKTPVVMKELEAFTKAEHSIENLLFLKAAAANTPMDKMLAGFIKAGSKFEININSPTRNGIVAGTVDMSVAVNEIKALVKNNALNRVLNTKAAETKKIIAAADKIIAVLEAEKKKLGAP